LKPVDGNRELAAQYQAGDPNAAERLYLANRSFLEARVSEVCRNYHCGRLRDDLFCVAALKFLELLDGYDAARDAELWTYLYPHIMGALRREVERNLGAISLSKRCFALAGQAKELHGEGRGTAEIAASLGVTEAFAAQLLSTPLNFLSLDALMEGDDEDDEVLPLQPASALPPVDQEAMKNIYLPLLRLVFEQLPFRDRSRLGGYFGVFGFEKETLAEIGAKSNAGPAAVAKSIDKIIARLARKCLEGELGTYRQAWLDVRKAQREGPP